MPTQFLGTVVIVSHNSGAYIPACLQALAPFTKWKVILVDNNSTDDTVSEARTAYPGMHTLINSHNSGFYGAVNQAPKTSEGHVLVILNPDHVATAGLLDKLAETGRTNTTRAADEHDC